MKKHFSLRELAEETRVPERTIRYYISRGIVPPPIKRGPKAAYGEEHVKTILRIKTLQSQGMTLSEIAREVALESVSEKLYVKEAQDKRLFTMTDFEEYPRVDFEKISNWYAYQITDEIIVLIRKDTSPWRIRKIITSLKEI